MIRAEWIPGEQEIRSGQEAYMRYVGGIVIINDPESEIAHGLHQLDVTPDNYEAIIGHAARLLYSGAKEVIASANPPRRRPISRAEHHFDQALPMIYKIVDAAYNEQRERIDDMNVAFFAIRPAAMTHETIYHQLCHTRRAKLRVMPLLDGFSASSYFDALDLENRTLNSLLRQPVQGIN